MFGETNGQKNSNIKDISPTSNTSIGERLDGVLELSYTKTNKLITALYMVTDIMDNTEPLRNKLRNLGANIISDTYRLKGQINFYNQINDRISETLSFLEIASNVGIISKMNLNILSKEFVELQKSILEFISQNEQKWLEEFIKEDEKNEEKNSLRGGTKLTLERTYFGHKTPPKGHSVARIGVQRGDTLMKALSDRIPDLSVGKYGQKNVLNKNISVMNNIHELKNKRREDIVSAIKDKSKNSINFDGATITDIRSIGHGTLSSCGEKTLQRELVSMVQDGVLKKTGEKRWSKYSIVG